jgi:hypothetical protein
MVEKRIYEWLARSYNLKYRRHMRHGTIIVAFYDITLSVFPGSTSTSCAIRLNMQAYGMLGQNAVAFDDQMITEQISS